MSNDNFTWWPIATSGRAISIAMVMVACSSTHLGQVGSGDRADFTSHVAADPHIADLLMISCFDCHSDSSHAAWSARLAPSYLFGADKARQALNFSDWPSYATQRKKLELVAIAKVISDGSMPPGDYDFVHPAARLSDQQKHELIEWISAQTGVPP